MKLKAITLFKISIFCLVFLTACQSTTISEIPPLYKSTNVEVSLIDDTNTIKYANYEWSALTDEIAYTKNTVILSGVASNIRQATVAYEFMDTNVSDSITIFDIKVSDVLSCRSGSFQYDDLVTVGVGYNMNKYGEGLPIIEDGKSYLIFCYVAADKENDVLELAEYVDCWISAPKDLFLEKIGDYYLSIDYFSNVPEALNLVDCLTLTEEQITSLSSIAVDDTDAICAYIDEEVMLGSKEFDLKDVASALFVLKTRTIKNSSELWNLANRSYLISCIELEEYVRNTAFAYDR